MRSPRFLSGALLIVVLVFAVFFYRNEALSFLGIIRSLDYEKLENLRLENLALKNELEKLKEESRVSGDSYLTAKVYSRYPWNDRRLVAINLGEGDGVRVGMPVLAQKGVLLGKVKNVFGRQSTVETIFDPAWRSSVIIGSAGTKALLEGGAEPALTLISKESAVSADDRVLNTSPEFPLNLLLGEVKEVRPVADEIWQTAALDALYDVEDLSEVLVVVNFP